MSTLQYTLDGKEHSLVDKDYPFEFTVHLPEKLKDAAFKIQVTDVVGNVTTENIPLQLKE
jgi:hypothetical protein